jgi:hypothetical protein
MADVALLDRAYDFIMRRLIADGRAPHYTDMALGLGVPPADGLRLLRELMAVGLPNWLHPDTDLIASFPPFNNLPTQYRLGVGGEWKWFAQCGLEALAACWAASRSKSPSATAGSSVRRRRRRGSTSPCRCASGARTSSTPEAT